MKEGITMKKFIVLIIMLVIACGTLFTYKIKKDKATSAYYSNLITQTNQIDTKINQLEEEIETLKDKYNITNQGTITLLFTELNSQLYDEIYPKMKEYGYVGMIALSSNQYPSKDGCISIAQYRKMMNNGWNSCYLWEDQDTLTSFQSTLDNLGLHPSKIMFFNDNYDDDTINYIYLSKFKAVISNSESYSAMTSKNDMSYINSKSYLNNSSDNIKNIINNNANMVYTISFNQTNNQYDSSTFTTLLKNIKTYTKKETLEVIDINDLFNESTDSSEYQARLEISSKQEEIETLQKEKEQLTK
jgi:hypothetical protein